MKSPKSQHSLLLKVESIAREAGKVALTHFGKVERLTKTHAAASEEAVTIADRLTQSVIVQRLRQEFPMDGIIGEEDDSGRGITFEVKDPDGRVWMIDPIDGTNNFIAGFGTWAVCIGLVEAGLPRLGVVYDVPRDLMYSGVVGEGALLNGQPMRVDDVPFSSKSVLMLTANAISPDRRVAGWMTKFIGQTEWKVRIIGSAALEVVSVASGVASAAVTVNGKIWDCAAPAAVLLAAGGVITTLTGDPIFPFELRGYTGAKVPFVAATPKSQSQILDAIRMNP